MLMWDLCKSRLTTELIVHTANKYKMRYSENLKE